VNEDRYFGSDLNKFIHEKCTNKMTCINIDCLLLRLSKKRLRIIESKHSLEKIKNSQLEVLKILFKVFKIAEKSKWFKKYFDGWTFEVWIVIGDDPYEDITIEHPLYEKKYVLTGDEFIQWLEFELELS